MKWVDKLVSGFHLFLYTGITFANFNLSGTLPVQIEVLNKWINGSIKNKAFSLTSLGSISSGPGDLELFSLLIIQINSFWVTGLQNKLFLTEGEQ